MGEGAILSSTIDMPQASSINRFSYFNPDRCMSTPQFNVTGFIDDTYCYTRGTQLEARIRTRSRGGSNSIDIRLRDDFSRLKVAVYEWGEIVCTRAHTVDVIDREHNVLCVQIEHKISEVLLGRGDYGLVGELGSLKDRLNAVRIEAKQLARAQLDRPYQSSNSVYDERLGEHSSTEVSVGGCNTENVFLDDPIPGVTHPNIRERDELNLSRINLTYNNVSAVSVLVCGQEPMRDYSPARLTAPQVLNSSETLGRRGVDVNNSQTLTEVLANLPWLSKDHQNEINVISESWMTTMKIRQDRYEEQLEKLKDNVVTLNITMQSAESSYRELQEDVESLKSNSSEVWQRLKTDEVRLNNLDKIISKVKSKVADNLEIVQEWFVDLTSRSSQEIPREIINSIQDVINDSSPGIAVDRIRDEIWEIRDSL